MYVCMYLRAVLLAMAGGNKERGNGGRWQCRGRLGGCLDSFKLKYLPSPSQEVWFKARGCPRALADGHADPVPPA